MNIKLSSKISKIRPSPTFALDSYVKSLQKKGRKIINLGLGEPDFNTPSGIRKAAVYAINSGFTHYTAVAGIEDLRISISDKFEKENKILYTPEQIVVGVGSKQLLYNAFQVLCNPGDEVIIAIPTWSTYIEQVKLAGAKPVFIHLTPPFRLKAKDINSKLTGKTKVLLINSPSNPTGAVIEKEELIKIARIAVKRNVFVVSDEIYEKIIYSAKNISIASLGQEIKDRTLTINGFSKAYAMTGWRIGYAGGPKEIITAMINIQGQTTSNTSSIAQKASLAAFTDSGGDVEVMVSEFKKRRNFLIKELSLIKPFVFMPPEGAFYFFINIKKLLGKKYKSSSDWCLDLLEKEGVCVIPGEAFETSGFIRLSFTTGIVELKEAVVKIKHFIKS